MKPLYTKIQFDTAKTNDKLPCECYGCKNIFYAAKREILLKLKNYKKDGGKNYEKRIRFCGKECKSKNQINKLEITCANCSKLFFKIPGEIKQSKSGNNFCCKSCAVTYNNKHKTTGNRRSKLEIWLESKLISLYPMQKILFNDKTTINSELDFYFPSLKLAFELNGIFHYEPIFGKIKLNQIQNNDERKFQACIEQGIEMCIIDVSSMKYFKENNCNKYLDIIIEVINKKNLNKIS